MPLQPSKSGQQEGGRAVQGVFVFDCVIHAYNMSDANLIDRPNARPARETIVGLGRQTRAPANEGLYPTFAKDWSREELWDMIFGRSVTDLAMAQTVPIFDWFTEGFAPVQAQYEFAAAYPDRVLFCGGVDPSYHGQGAVLDEMERQVKELRARSFKFYNAHIDGKSWRCDDEAVAYPMYEQALRLGVDVVQFHKGLPFGDQNMEDLAPNDLQKAARDFPNLRFVIHHLALPYFEECCSIAARFSNVYLAISGIVAMYFTRKRSFLKQLGQILDEVGADRILWGSEAALMGPPQPYLDVFWDLTIPEDLQEDYGFPQITELDKRKILGLNFAELMGVEVPAVTRS
jgi:predicted TIM-barrel fold metal-dependent hydrolase